MPTPARGMASPSERPSKYISFTSPGLRISMRLNPAARNSLSSCSGVKKRRKGSPAAATRAASAWKTGRYSGCRDSAGWAKSKQTPEPECRPPMVSSVELEGGQAEIRNHAQPSEEGRLRRVESRGGQALGQGHVLKVQRDEGEVRRDGDRRGIEQRCASTAAWPESQPRIREPAERDCDRRRCRGPRRERRTA